MNRRAEPPAAAGAPTTTEGKIAAALGAGIAGSEPVGGGCIHRA